MNYLFHLYLSDHDPPCLLGNLMGDFVKGRLDDRYPPAIRRGLAQHRQLDSFAHNHPAFRLSKARLHHDYGHCRGILVDIFYDHILAQHWSEFSPVPLEDFAAQVYQLLRTHHDQLAEGLQRIAPLMIERNWLVSYRDPAVIGRVLERVSQRLKRPLPMAQAMRDLEEHRNELEGDFRKFLEEARACLAPDKAWHRR